MSIATRYLLPLSPQQELNHLRNVAEQSQRDIINLQRQLKRPMGEDVIPDSGGTGSGGAIAGTLTSTLSRGGTATLSTGDTVTDNTEMPGTIALPVGTRIKAVLNNDGTTYNAIIPGWCYSLSGSLPGIGITSGASGTVTTAYGSPSAENRSESDALSSGWCMIVWDENSDEWFLGSFDPDCPEPPP